MPKKNFSDRKPRATIFRLVVALAMVVSVGGYLLLFHHPAAPDATFVSLTGERITTQSLRGKVVMVNFWSTSCTTCLHEMPKMVETYNQFKGQGLEYLAVAMQYDAPNYVIDYMQTRQLPFKVAYDANGKLAKLFGNVQATPTTFVIDKQGKIIKRYEGEPSFPALHQLLQGALKAEG
jgi:peroxiredoxin